MPGMDPRKQMMTKRKIGPKTFVVGKGGKREMIRGGKPVKETPEQPTIQLPPKKLLTGGQSKIAKKAPPFNKIDEKDFAVLRAEKAKGRGMGLQDEKVKPGKVMKAKEGKLTNLRDLAKVKGLPAPLMANPKFKDAGKFPAVSAGGKGGGKGPRGMGKITDPKSFIKRRMMLAGVKSALSSPEAARALRAAKATKIGKIAAGVAGVGLATKAYLNKKLEESRAKKKTKGKMGGGLMAATEKLKAQGKMGGGMMKRYTKGGGADMSKEPTSKMKASETARTYALAQSMKDKDRFTERDIKTAKEQMADYQVKSGRKKAKKVIGRLKNFSNQSKGFLKEITGFEKGGGADYMNTVKAKKRGNPAVVGKVKNLKKRMGGGMMKKPMGYKTGGGYDSGTPGVLRDIVSKYSSRLKKSGERLKASKKMGGGMMKKYSKGGGADMSGSRYKAFQVSQDVLKTLRDLPTGQEKLQNTVKQAKKFVRRLKATTRDSAKVQTKMGGGMMMKPMGYKSGKSIKVKCKLGRNKPTKMY